MGNAEIFCVPRDVKHFKEVAKSCAWKITEGCCFRIDGTDRTGALVDLLNRFAAQGINLQGVDAMAVDDKFGCYIWAKEDDVITIAEMLGVRSPSV